MQTTYMRNAGRQENRNRPETKWPRSIHTKIFVNFVCFCSKILSAPRAEDSPRCKCVLNRRKRR